MSEVQAFTTLQYFLKKDALTKRGAVPLHSSSAVFPILTGKT